MEIPILIERIGDDYILRCRNPVVLEVRASTYPEGRDEMQSRLSAILGPSVEVVPIQNEPQNPWLMSAGWLPDDAIAREWMAAMEANRKQDSELIEDTPEPARVPKSLTTVNGVGS